MDVIWEVFLQHPSTCSICRPPLYLGVVLQGVVKLGCTNLGKCNVSGCIPTANSHSLSAHNK